MIHAHYDRPGQVQCWGWKPVRNIDTDLDLSFVQKIRLFSSSFSPAMLLFAAPPSACSSHRLKRQRRLLFISRSLSFSVWPICRPSQRRRRRVHKRDGKRPQARTYTRLLSLSHRFLGSLLSYLRVMNELPNRERERENPCAVFPASMSSPEWMNNKN